MIRFTIRDLLWLMVVVALGLAWWIDRQQIERTRTQQIIQLCEEQLRLNMEIANLKGVPSN